MKRRRRVPVRHHAAMGDRALATLRAFRAAVYACFGRRRAALGDLLDAVVTAGPQPSLAHLSLAPAHRRGWGSLYAALRRGQLEISVEEEGIGGPAAGT